MATPNSGRRETRGKTGKTGATGKTGKTGKIGKIGKTGPRGPSMKRSEVLAIVADQFEEIRKQLDVQRKQLELQLQRTAQVQAQLDHVSSLVKRLVEDDASLKRLTALPNQAQVAPST